MHSKLFRSLRVLTASAVIAGSALLGVHAAESTSAKPAEAKSAAPAMTLPGSALVHITASSLNALQRDFSSFVTTITKDNPMAQVPPDALELAKNLHAVMGMKPGTVDPTKSIHAFVFNPMETMGGNPLAIVIPVLDMEKFRAGVTEMGGKFEKGTDGIEEVMLSGQGHFYMGTSGGSIILSENNALPIMKTQEILKNPKGNGWSLDALPTGGAIGLAATIDVRKAITMYEPLIQMALSGLSAQAEAANAAMAKMKPEDVSQKMKFRANMMKASVGYANTLMDFAKQISVLKYTAEMNSQKLHIQSFTTPIAGSGLEKFITAHKSYTPSLAAFLPKECTSIIGGFMKETDYAPLTAFLNLIINDLANATGRKDMGSTASSLITNSMNLYAGDYAQGIYMNAGDTFVTQVVAMECPKGSSPEKQIRSLLTSLNTLMTDVAKEVSAFIPGMNLVYKIDMAAEAEVINESKVYPCSITVQAGPMNLNMKSYIAEQGNLLLVSTGDQGKPAITSLLANLKSKKATPSTAAMLAKVKELGTYQMSYASIEPISAIRSFIIQSVRTNPAGAPGFSPEVMKAIEALTPAPTGMLVGVGPQNNVLKMDVVIPMPTLRAITDQSMNFMQIAMMVAMGSSGMGDMDGMQMMDDEGMYEDEEGMYEGDDDDDDE